MKNYVLKTTLLLLVTGLLSCSSDNDKKTSLEGTWAITHSEGYLKENGKKKAEWDEEYQGNDEEDQIEFTPCGQMRFWFGDDFIDDAYTYKKGKIYLDNYILVFDVLKHTYQELVLSLNVEVDEYEMYEKQMLKRIK